MFDYLQQRNGQLLREEVCAASRVCAINFLLIFTFSFLLNFTDFIASCHESQFETSCQGSLFSITAL